MPEGRLLGLLIQAHQFGVECSISELRSYEEFEGLGVLQACMKIETRLEEVGLEMTPPPTEGEMDQLRVISKKKTEDQFVKAFRDAQELGEGHEIEFKESLFLRKGINYERVPLEHHTNDELIYAAIKTVAGFLNADGGTLILGVNDNGDPVGLECEFPYMPNKKMNADGWALFWGNCLEKHFIDFKSIAPFVRSKQISIESKCICVVLVRPKPVNLAVCWSAKDRNEEVVYVRNSASTLQIKARAIESLVTDRIRRGAQR